MSSLCPSSPPAVPRTSRRKSSSASTTTSMDTHLLSFGHVAPYSPPLPSPALAPLHPSRRDECPKGGYLDDLDEVAYNYHVKGARPYSRRSNPLPHMHRHLPSLMTKFAAHALGSNAPPSYNPSSFPCASQTTFLYSPGDSAIADDGEEYDLESMNIHIRETYFATSAERGRWLSSPVAPRVRSQATPPMRGHSSPIKSSADVSPPKDRVRKHKTSCSLDEHNSILLPEDRDKDARYSSSLPPSSPITSPVSTFSFLSDHEDSFIDPRQNSDDCLSLSGTPELSTSSTTYPSPVEPIRMRTPPESTADAPCYPIASSLPPVHSISSRRPSPCSPTPVGAHVHTADFELDDALSPLSQFELDLPEEPPKLPLSDTVNKPRPGQHSGDPGVILEATRSQNGTPSIHSLSVNPTHEPGDSSSSRKKAQSRGSAGSSGATETYKRAVVRSRSPSSDPKRRRGMESRSSNRPEPPSKKSKTSQSNGDPESRGPKPHPRRANKRVSRSPSRPAVEGDHPEPPRARDRKMPKPTRRAQSQQPTSGPTTPVSCPPDPELHVALTGMLIEALAASRATSMDASTLYLVLTQAHPHIMTKRPKEELLTDIATVLEAGRTKCGMFEKVDGSGERSRNKALESRWFYVPEQDEDRERASLISAIMPRQKRNETKKYKQYYYRPLDKISRWDPEDAP